MRRDYKFAELIEVFKESVVNGYEDNLSKDEMANNAIYNLLEKCGGQVIYIPKSAKLYHRNNKIREEFNGENAHILAKRYRVSLAWIYKILKGEV